MNDLPGRLAMVFSHHPHEVFATGLLLEFKPDLLFLSHAHGDKNLEDQARAGLDAIGFEGTVQFLEVSEREVYARMIDGDFQWFESIRDQVTRWLEEKCPTAVMTDGFEAYNPVHDLCSLMVDASLIQIAATGGSLAPSRFEMPLAFGSKAGALISESEDPEYPVFSYELSGHQKSMKKRRCQLLLRDVPVDMAVSDHPASIVAGIHPKLFEKEFFSPVPPDRNYCEFPLVGDWKTYDEHGRQRVASGQFKKALTFAEHFSPMARVMMEEPVLVNGRSTAP